MKGLISLLAVLCIYQSAHAGRCAVECEIKNAETQESARHLFIFENQSMDTCIENFSMKDHISKYSYCSVNFLNNEGDLYVIYLGNNGKTVKLIQPSDSEAIKGPVLPSSEKETLIPILEAGTQTPSLGQE
ncbi:MAG: hypothetical protein KBD63_03285 [Bacteriovoracaceae bacterium]|nr:hypothetical protein [Bacteriovoracaceae bacterium]